MHKPRGTGRFPPAEPRRGQNPAGEARRGGAGRPPGSAASGPARRGRRRRGGWRRPGWRGGSRDTAAAEGGGAQPHRGFKAPRQKSFRARSRIRLPKAAPIPFFERGPRAAAPGPSPPDPGRPVAGRNRALCSPVKAPAVPELREEVSIAQTKSLFFALLSPAPAASFLAPKAYWK